MRLIVFMQQLFVLSFLSVILNISKNNNILDCFIGQFITTQRCIYFLQAVVMAHCKEEEELRSYKIAEKRKVPAKYREPTEVTDAVLIVESQRFHVAKAVCDI